MHVRIFSIATAVTKPVRCLGVAAFLLALAACSQTQTPEEAETPATEQTTPKPGAPKAPAKTGDGLRPVVADKPFVPQAPGVRVSRVAVPGPYVALTFDDGPHASYTPQILDILKRHGAHATFFVLGSRAASHPGILARAVAEGNEIGSHTWNHMNMARSSHAAICSDLDRTAAAIEKATGKRPRVMRPPYGAANSAVTSLVYGRYGTPAILWDVDTQDWRRPGVGVVVDRAVSKARSGSIILVHDIHASTLAAVEGIVSGLQARGFKLVTVSQLMALGRRAAGVADAPAPAAPVPAVPQSAPVPAASLPEEGAGAASIGSVPPPVSPAAGDSPLPQGQFFQPFTPES